MAFDFTKIPHFLQNIDPNYEPKSRTLLMMGKALELAYNLLEHPAIKSEDDFENDPFIEIMKSPENYKYFNRGVIERTIQEAELYGKEDKNGILISVSSKSAEIALSTLDYVLTVGNSIINQGESSADKTIFEGNSYIFKLDAAGRLIATLKWLSETCQSLIIKVRKDQARVHLSELADGSKKVPFLIKELANLEQNKDFTSPRIYEELGRFFDIELSAQKDIADNENNSQELAGIVEKFFSEVRANVNSDDLLRNLVNQNLVEFKKGLENLILQTMSFHDFSGQEPEKVYHVLLLTLLLRLNSVYEITSNREAGLGRFDILMSPIVSYQRGIIFEVKIIKNPSEQEIQEAHKRALDQVEKNKYFLALKSKGIKEYIAFSAVFSGKMVFLEHRCRTILD